jgi:hypothetical protein
MSTSTQLIDAAGRPAALNLQPGEHYAGVIRDAQGQVQHHLVLLAAVPATRLTWQGAMAWAESVGGALPTRQEQDLLFTNCRSHIKPDWYWSGEQHSASYAWYCHFYYGDQSSTHKSYEGCARAVRRIQLTA